MGAMIVAGAMLGCEETNRLPPAPECAGGVCNADIGSASYKQKDLVSVPEICKDGDRCLDAPECADGAAFAACLCVSDTNRCQTMAACNGIGACTYKCEKGFTFGEEKEEVCGWPVCDGTAGCKGTCIPDQLPGDEDYDEDGILNRIERDSNGLLDPCIDDSDGDGVKDGDEDLNHNGKYEPWLGESNPGDGSDPGSSSDPDVTAQLALKNALCTRDAMLAGNNGSYKHMRVAKFPGASYIPAADANATVVRFDDTKHGVVGFYGSDRPFNGNQLLSQANLTQGSYIEESNATASVPMASWLEGERYLNGVENTDKVNLQVVPDHTVNRYKYAITLDEGESLEDVRDKIAGVFQSGLTATSSTKTYCNSDDEKDNRKAILYLERSTGFHKYGQPVKADNVNLFSGALVCSKTNTESKADNSSAIEAMNILQDVISGTTVSPTLEGFKQAPMGGYMPFKNFVCQAENYGDSSGQVDFIWVVDNSGSMQDELDTLAETVELFAKGLEGTGIDYRVAIATTDSYSVDEWPGNELNSSTGYYPAYNIFKFESDNDVPTGIIDRFDYVYFNFLGVHSLLLGPTGDSYSGFMDKEQIQNNILCQSNGCPDGEDPESYEKGPFVLGVRATYKDACGSGKNESVMIKDPEDPEGKKLKKLETLMGLDIVANICGKGIEDGFKSGSEVLRRLAIDVMKDTHEELGMSAEEWAQFREFKLKSVFTQIAYKNCTHDGDFTQPLASSSTCKALYESITTRDEALKYIIWVSDEESRQFKEGRDKDNKLLKRAAETVYGCYTGYKLDYTANGQNYDYTMRRGHLNAGENDESSICNAPMKDELANLIAQEKLTEDMSLEDIKKAAPEYYHMLMYYMNEYRKFAGKGGVAAWAIVGDAGLAAGKACKNLSVCDGKCCRDAECSQPETGTGLVGCFSCEGSWRDDPIATVGANYGLSYIHAARFLSTLTDDGKNDGKEGGFSSICNDNLETTITDIYNDVAGRVASHPLKGYPISSTIRVAYYKKNTKKLYTLTRGAAEFGWSYDASQNAVLLLGIPAEDKPDPDDPLVISYVIWEEFNG